MARLLMSPWADGRVPFAGCRVLGACEDKGAFLLNLLSAFPQQCVWGVGGGGRGGGRSRWGYHSARAGFSHPVECPHSLCMCVSVCVVCSPEYACVCVFV